MRKCQGLIDSLVKYIEECVQAEKPDHKVNMPAVLFNRLSLSFSRSCDGEELQYVMLCLCLLQFAVIICTQSCTESSKLCCVSLLAPVMQYGSIRTRPVWRYSELFLLCVSHPGDSANIITNHHKHTRDGPFKNVKKTQTICSQPQILIRYIYWCKAFVHFNGCNSFLFSFYSLWKTVCASCTTWHSSWRPKLLPCSAGYRLWANQSSGQTAMMATAPSAASVPSPNSQYRRWNNERPAGRLLTCLDLVFCQHVVRPILLQLQFVFQWGHHWKCDVNRIF